MRYGMVYLRYKSIFFNLIISRIIINTFICNLISVIVTNSSRRSHGCRHTAESSKTLCVFFLFFFFDSYHHCCTILNTKTIK